MKLADRLDRLRSAAGAAAVGDSATLQRLARSRDRAAVTMGTPASLARALGAEQPAPGLLLTGCAEYLPGPARLPGELTDLPEVAGLAGPGRADPDWVYLDIETTGLSGGVGNLAFLVGVGRLDGGQQLRVRQYLLAGFAGERALLQGLCDWIGPRAVLVSYNGKGFDVPVLQGRTRMHGLPFDWTGPAHLDLLYTVRRAYRRLWSDCRLQTAERRLLDLRRIDDLPGAEAPAAWHAWLRQGKVDGLRRVLRHNLQDLVSLARLHRLLVREYAPTANADGRADVDYTAVGQAWLSAGHADRAQQVWRAAGGCLDAAGQLALAALYRRNGHWQRAEPLWLALHARGDARAASELSKYYEHRRRDYDRALCFAAACEPAERAVRCARLVRKMDVDPLLPLTGGG